MADVAINADTANIPAINFGVQGSDPTAPAAGRCLLYVKSGGVYVRYNGGAATPVGGAATLTTGRLGIGDANGLLSAMALGTEGQLVTANASGLPAWANAPGSSGDPRMGDLWIPCFCYIASTGVAPVFSTSYPAFMYTTTWFIRNATGDTLSYTADLPAGTYTVETIYAKSNDAGINDVTLGGVSAGSFDGYNGSTTYNHRLTTTGVVIASAGIKALVVTSNGKNASSTNYRLGLCGFHIWRTA